MKFENSQTYKNLLAAFAGESQARNKYSFFASVAKKDGFQQVAAIFEETADNEKEHAKRIAKMLGNIILDTAHNLEQGVEGEHEEWTSMYPGFARVAMDEGFDEVAQLFRGLAKVEEEHEKRFAALLERVKSDIVFTRDEPVRWHCRNCGNIHTGKEAPEICPVCLHPRAYYEEVCENY